MKLPSLLRRTPFRLTLLFLALFAAAASAILAYVYFASAAEARVNAEREVRGEMQVLVGVYDARGFDALNKALIDRSLTQSAVNSPPCRLACFRANESNRDTKRAPSSARMPAFP